MIQVVKRDGEVAEFSLNKITEAIKKAFRATSKDYNNEILELLSLRVTADFQNKMKDGRISVEEIQDSVEHVLEQTGYTDVAKAYILYRKQREKIRNMNSTILDYKDVVNSYVKVEDWRVKENSTVTYSVGGLILSNSGAVTANYWLSEIYDQEIDICVGGPPQCGHPHPRFVHAYRILCGLVLKAAPYGRPGRHHGKDYLLAGKASVRALQPDGQLPWNHAE